MARLSCDFYSDALGVSTSMTVILPEATKSQIGMTGAANAVSAGFPTLYLLHGLSDDHTIWSRRTSIERYVAPLGLAVVMPAVSRSFYTDEAYGLPYWTFLSEELPAKVEAMFRLSTAREHRYVAGLSMGGYGAFKWALRKPEQFAAAASLSGAVDLAYLDNRVVDGDPVILKRLFGDSKVAASSDDLFSLVARVTDPPALYLACGTEDALIGANHRLVQACAEAGLDVRTDFGPGEHEWGYWDRTIQDVLAWLPLPGRGEPS